MEGCRICSSTILRQRRQERFGSSKLLPYGDIRENAAPVTVAGFLLFIREQAQFTV